MEVLGSQTEIPKGLKKIRSSGVEEGLTILVFEGHGGGGVGVEHLEFPKARGS